MNNAELSPFGSLELGAFICPNGRIAEMRFASDLDCFFRNNGIATVAATTTVAIPIPKTNNNIDGYKSFIASCFTKSVLILSQYCNAT